MSRARSIALVLAALTLVVVGNLVRAGWYPTRAGDVLPTPAPVRDLTPASPAAPPSGITNPHTYGSTCTGWYLEKNYAYSWPAATMWWEAECQAYDPACWPVCETDDGDPPLLIDLYYWDGSTAIFYGEQIYMHYNSGTGCQYWLDAATGLTYQYDTRVCPWTA